jgi:hypothetical protein
MPWGCQSDLPCATVMFVPPPQLLGGRTGSVPPPIAVAVSLHFLALICALAAKCSAAALVAACHSSTAVTMSAAVLSSISSSPGDSVPEPVPRRVACDAKACAPRAASLTGRNSATSERHQMACHVAMATHHRPTCKSALACRHAAHNVSNAGCKCVTPEGKTVSPAAPLLNGRIT